MFLRKLDGNRHATYAELLKSLSKHGFIDQLTPNQITQAAEAAIALAARNTVRHNKDTRYNFDNLMELYDRQPTIQAKEGRNLYLQQYSTPAPLAYLAGEFVRNGKTDGHWFEPSAGNALLTTAFKDCGMFILNELDPDRCHNLELLYKHGSSCVILNKDASDKDWFSKGIVSYLKFDGVITNPPFGQLKEDYRHKSTVTGKEYLIESLDHKMALLALSRMKPDGRAAVIVGGKLFNAYWKPLADSDKKIIYGKWKEFLLALYDQYNVVDCIYIDGSEIYKKQGTTYPIALLLIDGCNEVAQKPNFVFDPERDIIVKTYDQLYDRIAKHLGTPLATDKEKKLKLLKLLKLKAEAEKEKMKMEE